jgi:hypothetical protein
VDVAGTYTVTYNVTDSAGNDADEQSRTVTVEEEAPAPPAVLGETDEETEEDVTEEEDEDGEVLGLQCEVKQTITGYIYVDANGNGERDEDEEGVPGVELDLIYTDENGDMTVVDTITTDEDGRWRAEVCPGAYEVVLDEETLPDDLDLDGTSVLGISVGDDSGEHNINFPLTSQEGESAGFDWKWVVIGLVSLVFIWFLYNFFQKGMGGGPTYQTNG